MKKFVLIAFFILISGCAITPTPYLIDTNSAYQSVNNNSAYQSINSNSAYQSINSNSTHQSIKCENNRYLKTELCSLPSVGVSYGRDIGRYELIWIKSGKFKKISLSFRVYLKDWIFFDSVYDINGNSLKVSAIDRDVARHGVIESISVELKQEYLEKAKATGLNLAIYGKKGRKHLNIPASYIAGFVKFLKEKQESEKQQKN